MTDKGINRCLILLVIVFLAGLSAIGCYGYFLWNADREWEQLKQMAESFTSQEIPAAKEKLPDGSAALPETQKEDFDRLKEQNGDFAGWISIPGSEISYPVMHTPGDPEYYLRRSFTKKYSPSGVPFLDGECSLFPRSDNLIIYGHHMKNGSVFSELLSYEKKDYWETHKEVKFSEQSGTVTYEVLAAFPLDVQNQKETERLYFIQFSDQADFLAYYKMIKKKALYDTGVTPQYGDRLLTLSTCSYHVQDGRFLVIAAAPAAAEATAEDPAGKPLPVSPESSE